MLGSGHVHQLYGTSPRMPRTMYLACWRHSLTHQQDRCHRTSEPPATLGPGPAHQCANTSLSARLLAPFNSRKLPAVAHLGPLSQLCQDSVLPTSGPLSSPDPAASHVKNCPCPSADWRLPWDTSRPQPHLPAGCHYFWEPSPCSQPWRPHLCPTLGQSCMWGLLEHLASHLAIESHPSVGQHQVWTPLAEQQVALQDGLTH